MDVYRAVHPPKWTLADSMELESFATRCQTRCGIDVFGAWRDDITLGEVFALTRTGMLNQAVEATADPLSS